MWEVFWGEQRMFNTFYAYFFCYRYASARFNVSVSETICWYNNGGELLREEYFSCLINTYYNKYYNIGNKINILKGKRWFCRFRVTAFLPDVCWSFKQSKSSISDIDKAPQKFWRET